LPQSIVDTRFFYTYTAFDMLERSQALSQALSLTSLLYQLWVSRLGWENFADFTGMPDLSLNLI